MRIPSIPIGLHRSPLRHVKSQISAGGVSAGCKNAIKPSNGEDCSHLPFDNLCRAISTKIMPKNPVIMRFVAVNLLKNLIKLIIQNHSVF